MRLILETLRYIKRAASVMDNLQDVYCWYFGWKLPCYEETTVFLHTTIQPNDEKTAPQYDHKVFDLKQDHI